MTLYSPRLWRVSKVTRQQIIDAANSFKLDGVYVLTSNTQETEESHDRRNYKNDRIHEQYIRIKHKSGCNFVFILWKDIPPLMLCLLPNTFGGYQFKTEDEDFVTVPEGMHIT